MMTCTADPLFIETATSNVVFSQSLVTVRRDYRVGFHPSVGPGPFRSCGTQDRDAFLREPNAVNLCLKSAAVSPRHASLYAQDEMASNSYPMRSLNAQQAPHRMSERYLLPRASFSRFRILVSVTVRYRR
jgi:hypothetical protein